MIEEDGDVPCISLVEPTTKLPEVNVKELNLKFEDVVNEPEGLFTSILTKTALTDIFVKVCAPLPEKIILAPAGHVPKQFAAFVSIKFPLTFKTPEDEEKVSLPLVAFAIFKSLQTALPSGTEIVCPSRTKTLVVAVGNWPEVAATHPLPL